MKKLAVFLIAVLIASLVPAVDTKADDKACYLSDEVIAYCKDAEDAFDISASLIASIIQIESSGNPLAQNGPCKGLMQVHEMHIADSSDLFDADTNIRFGVAILDECKERANNELYLALMYYNGQSDADAKFNRWLDNGAVGYPSKYVERVLELQKRIDEEWY